MLNLFRLFMHCFRIRLSLAVEHSRWAYFREGYLRLRFGGLIFGRVYLWRGLLSEFYGISNELFHERLDFVVFRQTLDKLSTNSLNCTVIVACSVIEVSSCNKNGNAFHFYSHQIILDSAYVQFSRLQAM